MSSVREHARYTLGLFYLFLSCVIWSLASVMTQYIYNDLQVRKKFALNWSDSSHIAYQILPLLNSYNTILIFNFIHILFIHIITVPIAIFFELDWYQHLHLFPSCTLLKPVLLQK
jgi:hypothetical protein